MNSFATKAQNHRIYPLEFLLIVCLKTIIANETAIRVHVANKGIDLLLFAVLVVA